MALLILAVQFAAGGFEQQSTRLRCLAESAVNSSIGLLPRTGPRNVRGKLANMIDCPRSDTRRPFGNGLNKLAGIYEAAGVEYQP